MKAHHKLMIINWSFKTSNWL